MAINTKLLTKLKIPPGQPFQATSDGFQAALKDGFNKSRVIKRLKKVVERPAIFTKDPYFGGLATLLLDNPTDVKQSKSKMAMQTSVPCKIWGEGLDSNALEQIHNACALPIAVRGALMPDAHVGYGLPIGGVLATRNSVIPYAVGVDIACRVKLSVLDLPVQTLSDNPESLKAAIASETRFGIGAAFKKQRRQHDVMDRDWSVSPVTKANKDRAWEQLGTSGSGNHFVEFGILELDTPLEGLDKGHYLALLSHSGSRGTGALICQHYSKVAQMQQRALPNTLRHLAWLDLDSAEGREYWAAMQLMGEYAAANHFCIHKQIAKYLGATIQYDLENHHNFAWMEEHYNEKLIVHRKGATPAGSGVLGIIPGTMATPAYIVRGLGNVESLNSAAHGAGRLMSRKQAHRTIRQHDLEYRLNQAGVTLLSAGLDEAPMVYKDIDAVMAAQTDLVTPLARFHPKLVKMAQSGERPED